MNRVLFTGQTREWHDALLPHPPEAAEVAFLPLEPDTLLSGGRGVITVMDSATWSALPAGPGRERIRASLILILLPGSELEAVRQMETAALGVHRLIQGPSGGELSNFRQLLTLAFRVQTMERRLENYITDSFRDIVDTHLLQQQKKQIEDLNRQLEHLSRTDALTHLLNRRALMESFELEKKRALRTRWRLDHQQPEGPAAAASGKLTDHIGNFTCLMVDIDHFKSVNDVHGHLAGDEVLRQFGELILNGAGLRENDVIGRYGGEEFLIILPDTNAENALVPARRLRQKVKELAFRAASGEVFHVTISIGVAEFLPEELDISEMIHRADQALYQAKTSGRDRVCIYGRPGSDVLPP